MAQRRYGWGWRLLAGLVTVIALGAFIGAALGPANRPGWGAIVGFVLVLLLLPHVALTGRAPAWLERALGRRDV